MEKLDLPEKIKNNLIKKQYGIYNHSAVQICSWTKKALTNRGVCYKEKFYGVDCSGCMEMSPVSMWCQHNCTFCWRPMEYMKNIEIDENQVDSPKDIIDNLIIQRKKLISGIGGHNQVDRKKWEEALIPKHFAISLSGEPTLYPKLNEMIRYLKSLETTKTIFIVSNGQKYEYFENLINDELSQPTQLYVSIDAPTEELYKKINCSVFSDGWNRTIKTLEALKKIKCRTVYRMTQIKGLNDLDEHLESYSKIIEIGTPDIIEVKAYMHLGNSQMRHTKDQMPEYVEVLEFAKKIIYINNNYEIVGEMEPSRIVILKRKDSKYETLIEKFEN